MTLQLQAQDILWLDEQLCVLNKQSGLPTRARPGLGGDCLYQAALRLLDVERLWLVHYLDRVTSGVLVLARTRAAAADLSAQFERRSVRKTYLAWVEGRPPQVSGRIDLPLTREGGRPRVDLGQGKPASTRYRVLDCVPEKHVIAASLGAPFPAGQAEGRTLLYLRPYTGRTHQLRVHLAAIGCPIVGDPIHGHGRPEDECLLHALELRLRHPQDGGSLILRAPPRDGFPVTGA